MRFLEFFRRQFLLTHIYGIPVRIDYRWFVVIILLTWLNAVAIPDSLVGSLTAKIAFGFSAIIVFFFTIFLHELAHAYIAKKEGIQVLEILLHPFGGLAKLKREPHTPRAEFRIAIAGPIASFVIAFIFLGFFALSRSLETNILTPLFFIIFLLNLMLAVFNLFPGYPLDGGRVLRAFLWRRGTDLTEATVLTGRFGQWIAAVLILFGIFISLISFDILTGLWTILVGIFLFDAARGIIKQVTDFDSLLVDNLMEMPATVPPEISVMKFVDTILPLHRRDIFPVSDERQLYGFLVLKDLKKNLPREKWHETNVRDVMRAVREDHFVQSGTTGLKARELMKINGIGALGVVDGEGKLIGFLQHNRLRKRS